MATPSTTADFVSLVRKSGVVAETELAEYLDRHEGVATPQECATELVRAKLLTPFQAKNLLNGRYRGLVLGPYKLLQPLGQGGMGVVYLAEHTLMKRKVAVKVLPHDKAIDQLSLDRFYREARAAAALDHPNIVRLHDVSQGAGVHFLVMEYVDGANLQTLLDTTGPLHFVPAVEYVAQAAAGLQHAHEKGFVHRDIKPANLMRDRNGVVKILDMGLTRSFIDPKDELTAAGENQGVTGTADYLAPEQALNQAADARSDIYSLGMTLFTLITGQTPYQGTTAQKLLQHQMRELPRLSQLRATVPPALSDVVAKMTAKQPEDRYQTVGEVIDALSPWLPAVAAPPSQVAGNPLTQSDLVTARDTVRVAKAQTKKARDRSPPPRRKRVILAAAIGLTLIVVVGVAWAAFGGRKSKTDSDSAQAAPPAAPPAGPAGPPGPPKVPPKSGPPSQAGERLFPLPLAGVTTATTARPLFYDRPTETIVPDRWGRWTVRDVPFDLIDPQGGAVNNIIMLNSTSEGGTQSRGAPERVTIPVNSRAEAIHFLGMTGGWCWPYRPSGAENPRGKVVLVVRLSYADGLSEEYPLRNGEHIADYIRAVDVPGSELAFMTRAGRQVRYLAIRPRRDAVITQIQLEKGELEYAAPVVFAVTVERPQ
jgi:serine/threonine protein kinase